MGEAFSLREAIGVMLTKRRVLPPEALGDVLSLVSRGATQNVESVGEFFPPEGKYRRFSGGETRSDSLAIYALYLLYKRLAKHKKET